MFKVVYKEKTDELYFERVIFRSADLTDCEQLIANHQNCLVKNIREMAEDYVILDENNNIIVCNMAA